MSVQGEEYRNTGYLEYGCKMFIKRQREAKRGDNVRKELTLEEWKDLGLRLKIAYQIVIDLPYIYAMYPKNSKPVILKDRTLKAILDLKARLDDTLYQQNPKIPHHVLCNEFYGEGHEEIIKEIDKLISEKAGKKDES